MLMAAVLLRLLHRRCEEVLEVFALKTICLEGETKKYLTTLRGWRAVLEHLGDFSSLRRPTSMPEVLRVSCSMAP